MKYTCIIFALFIALQYSSCKTNIQSPSQNPDDNPALLNWLIPKNEILNRGAGNDSIPAILEPAFMSPGQVHLKDSDLVVGVNVEGEFRVYPHNILNYHEVVNDIIKNRRVTITYCPYSGTAMAWETTNLNGLITTFAISKLIYNSNHILYDKVSKSYWQQMYSKCVAGSMQAFQLTNYGIVETTWANWKFMFPSVRVLSTATGYHFNYNIDPYSKYASTDTIVFYTQPIDNRLPLKERVHALVVGGHVKVFRFNSFADSISVIQDNFQGLSVVLAGSKSRNFIVSYERRIPNGPELDFSVNTDANNFIMVDNEGTKWDIFGVGVDGPRIGQRLNPTQSMMAYWFAVGGMFKDALIY